MEPVLEDHYHILTSTNKKCTLLRDYLTPVFKDHILKSNGVYRNQLVRLSVCPVKKFTKKKIKKIKKWGGGD